MKAISHLIWIDAAKETCEGLNEELKSDIMRVLATVRNALRKHLSESQKRTVRHHLYRLLYGKDLRKLAGVFGSDKEGRHFYAKHYQNHFASLRHKRLNILEIGIGGYENPRGGGASLRMWKAYFPKGMIFGVDIHDKTHHDEKRIKTFKGSQVDEEFLRNIIADIGTVDIIIDDGSHVNAHVITTFKILFPLLATNGIYVVEDLQTSYWEKDFGGSSILNAEHTSMNFLKTLVDGLNYEEFTARDYSPTYLDKHVVSTHFYHNLAFIYKGENNEGSNIMGKRFL